MTGLSATMQGSLRATTSGRAKGREPGLAAPTLKERVVVHGQVSVAEVAGSTLPLMSSRWRAPGNPSGMAHGEAMAAGMPVIGRPAGNLPYLADGGEGRAVSPGDVAALADALCRLVTDGRCGVRWVSGPAARRRTCPRRNREDVQC